MKRKHIPERQIQLYASGHPFLRNQEALQRHFRSCSVCGNKLDMYEELERQLGSLPLLEPTEGFTDRVMNEVFSPRVQVPPQPLIPAKRNRFGIWNSEVIHLLVASAATYLFIASGFLRTIVSQDPDELSYGLQEAIQEAVGAGGQLYSGLAELVSKIFLS